MDVQEIINDIENFEEEERKTGMETIKRVNERDMESVYEN